MTQAPPSPFAPPSLRELRQQRLKYLNECRPDVLREFKSERALRAYLNLKARAAQQYAANLVQSGEGEAEAWNRAVRLEILGSESD